MKFEIRMDPNDKFAPFDWIVTVQGEIVAAAPDSYSTEQQARSAIAKARKAFGGYKFAKVVSHVE